MSKQELLDRLSIVKHDLEKILDKLVSYQEKRLNEVVTDDDIAEYKFLKDIKRELMELI